MGAAQRRLDQGTDGGPPRPSAGCSGPDIGPNANSADPAGQSGEPDGRPAPSARLAAADERERLSRDLHDLVLQRLFGLAATLSALRTSTSDARAAERLGTCVQELDQTINAIRDGILDQTPLQAEPAEPRPAPPPAVVALAQAVVAEHG